jgi:hypothetical protein
MGNNYNKSFNFRNGVQVDNDNFIVNPNGLVGIGTSIPREFLDVYGTAKVTGLVTTTDLYVSGFTTVSNLKIGNISISSGIISATTGIITYYGNGENLLNLPTSQWVDVDSGFGYTSIYAAGNVGIATTYPNYTFQVGGNPSTSNGVGFNSTGDVYISGIVTATTASITNTTTTNLTSTASTTTSLRVSGTGTIATLNAVTGVVTTISGTNLTYGGTGSINTLNAVTGVVTTISGTTATYNTANITTLNSTTTGTIANLTNTNLTSTVSTINHINNVNLRTTGVATIQTLKTVDGTISYFTGENGSYTGNIRSDTLNSNSGIVTTLSGTTLNYSGTGSIGTLNANTGIVTTISGTTATYDTGNITTLSSTITGTITNLTSTNIDAAGIITATNGFRGALTGNVTGNLTGTASYATQLVTPKNFSITGNFVTAPAVSFDGTVNVALAATIAPNSIVLGTYTSGNYVRSISGVANQIYVSALPIPGGQPEIGLTNNVTINNDLYIGNNIGIGTTAPEYNLDITTGDGFGVGISNLGNINATGIITASIFSGTATNAGYATTAGISTVSQGLTGNPNISVGIITASNLKIGTGVTVQSGIVTATNGFSSGIGTAVQITTVGNKVFFTVAGVGATSLTLF